VLAGEMDACFGQAQRLDEADLIRRVQSGTAAAAMNARNSRRVGIRSLRF
jgi:hypothetical protein